MSDKREAVEHPYFSIGDEVIIRIGEYDETAIITHIDTDDMSRYRIWYKDERGEMWLRQNEMQLSF